MNQQACIKHYAIWHYGEMAIRLYGYLAIWHYRTIGKQFRTIIKPSINCQSLNCPRELKKFKTLDAKGSLLNLVTGVWLQAHGSWLMDHGSWPMAHGKERGARPGLGHRDAH